ncbi:MAG: bifunctional phosphoglucose/phosphomannose isomerase [Calditrichaeota bacterium]|nr:MAG: bifunctional phosphoglucose/phosphomannose isomerase [Calditrichota bacterium]MBL1206428.1 bifunctional phosphoglucose/phosphomannose isomerase [Calditrichota bacterium]NOG46254.1 bifunctional phosphoglucose/phosphomannose isomerase [Calditrichota bacterium]
MFSHDKSGFKDLLLDFNKQIDQAEKIAKSAQINIKSSEIHNILYFGMGGSAISGDLLNDILIKDLNVPLKVVRGYISPKFCSKNTLVIVSSYSGNTEETVSAAKMASDSGAQFLAVTSGGIIADLAKQNNWNILNLPTGYPPRQALGFTFFSLYHVLGQTGLAENYEPDLNNLKRFVRDEIIKHDTLKHDGHVLAQELAKTIHHKIPVIYSSSPFLKTVSKRWQNQLHENSKSLAFSNVIPEMNHNEIVGWEMESDLKKSVIAVFLENETVHPRIKERIELSKTIIKESGAEVVDVYASGDSILEKAFSLIVLGDWVSYYLAMFNKKDPHTIKNIDYLKNELAKTL